MEDKIRQLIENAELGFVQGLLVDSADWGVNIRMTMDDEFIEIDLIKNWDGFEVIFINNQSGPFQIDNFEDLPLIIKNNC